MPIVIAGLAVILCAGVASAATTRKVPSEAYPTIQSAVDAADAGDTILVSKKKDGTAYEEWVTATKSLKFIGKKVVWDGHIVGPGSGRCLTVGSGVPVNGVVVQGFTFRNGSSHVYIGGDGALVQSCTFSGAYGIALEMEGNGARIQKCTFRGSSWGVDIAGDDIVLEKNTATGHSAGGFRVAGSWARFLKNRVLRTGYGTALTALGPGATISGNTLTGGHTGIYVAGDDALVEKNRISRFTGDDTGIRLLGRGARILSNQVGQIASNGIYVDGNSGASVAPNLVEGNTIRSADGHGIYADGWTATIRGNTVAQVAGIGIFCTYAAVDTGSTVEGNTVTDTFDDGIYVSGGGYDVVGNRVQDAGNAGIRCGGGSYIGLNSIRDNQVEGFAWNGIFVNSSDGLTCQVEGNILSEGMSTSAAIYVYAASGAGVTARGNRVSGCGGNGIQIYAPGGAAGMAVEDNIVEDSGVYWSMGISFYGAGASVSGNSVTGMIDAGIYVEGNGNTLDGNTVEGCSRVGIGVSGVGNMVTGNTGHVGDGEGFGNRGTGTVLTGNTFLGFRLDVANSGTFATPDIKAVNTFKTGGAASPIQVWD